MKEEILNVGIWEGDRTCWCMPVCFSWYRYTTFISAWICETFQARDATFTLWRALRVPVQAQGNIEDWLLALEALRETTPFQRGLRTACYDLNTPRSSKGKLVGFGRILVILDGKTSLFHGFPSFFPDINSVKQPGFTPCHEISLFPPSTRLKCRDPCAGNATFAPGSADRCGAWSWELQTLSIQAAANWGFHRNWVLRLGWKVA